MDISSDSLTNEIQALDVTKEDELILEHIAEFRISFRKREIIRGNLRNKEYKYIINFYRFFNGL